MANKPKQQLRDHTQQPVNDWKGLYVRSKEDTVPSGYLIDTLNTVFHSGEIATRNGCEIDFTLPNIRRFFIYKRLNETQRYLVLDTDGSLWDSLYPGSPLITNAGFLDFSAINYLNRAYITFHNRVTGIPGTFIYVYEGGGPGTLRLAAGNKPSGFTLVATTSLNSGVIDPGTYLITVSFETTSGFITAPGPEVFTVYVAPGGFMLDLSNIPIGPVGTVARRILITQAIPDYSGNQFGYEFFFLPEGRIGDNVTTVLNSINFYSANLNNSADFLFDIRETLPAGLGLTIYKNKMVLWGVPGYEHYVFLSKEIEVEIFNEIDGFLFLDPSEGISGVTNTVDFSESLYIQTRSRSYVTIDNGSAPNTWSAGAIDKDIGAEIFTVGKILDSRGTSIRRFFQGDPGGIYCFESGTFQDPVFTYNVDSVWKRINKNHFNKVQIAHDSKNQLVYAAVPLDFATECNYMLVGDYSFAFNRFGMVSGPMVRWSLWMYPWDISGLAVDLDLTDVTVLKVAGFPGNIYKSNDGYLDNLTKITSYVQTHFFRTNPHFVHHFGFLSFNVTGQGTLDIRLIGKDNIKSSVPPPWTLNPTDDRIKQKPVNFVDPFMSVRLRCTTNAGDYFTGVDLLVDVKPLWAETARLE